MIELQSRLKWLLVQTLFSGTVDYNSLGLMSHRSGNPVPALNVPLINQTFTSDMF